VGPTSANCHCPRPAALFRRGLPELALSMIHDRPTSRRALAQRRSVGLSYTYPVYVGQLPDNDELLAAVAAAGWLLEQRAVRILTAADLHPRAGWAFEDSDDLGTSRELDVWSYRQLLDDEDAKVRVRMSILVECKQSGLPYAAIGQDLPEWRFHDNPTQHVLPLQHFPVRKVGNQTWTEPAWDVLGFRNLSRDHGDIPFRANQLTRLDRIKGDGWSASNSGIFTSLVYPLAKALRASQKGIKSQDYQFAETTTPRSEYLEFALHFPVVLISSPLYVVDASQSEPLVEQRSWVTALRELKSKSVKGLFEFDIVTEAAFSDYVDEKVALAQAIAELVATDPTRCTGETWTMTEG